MVKEIIPFFIPQITRQDKESINSALKSQWLTGGPLAIEFERQFSEYIGVKYAVAVNSCTAALHLSLMALNIKHGDEVIVPAMTFAATANAAIYCGARPVFADIDPDTFNISPEDIGKRITPKTRAIIVVHYAGQPCDMDSIQDIAQKNNLFIIEDCAHSLGATYKKKKTGSIGITGCFSFYPTKNITTLEGGMVTTDDKRIAEKIGSMRSHCMSKQAFDRSQSQRWYYDITELGYNYRMNAVSSALGISQLGRVEKTNQKRARRALYYTKLLKQIKGIVTPYNAENRKHVYHLYVIKVQNNPFGINRNKLFDMLAKQGISTSVHYTPLHMLSFYRKLLGEQMGQLPVSEAIYKEILSLPLYPTLKYTDIKYVVENIMYSVE
jgi:dTDP-4-amino-4,6-dideoxygalactose transaminase